MQLKELFAKARIPLPDMEDRIVSGIATDSRCVREGALFIALRGRQVDGHTYMTEARCRGAAAVVGEDPAYCADILVKNTREAAARIYDAWYDHPAKDMTLIGVTGTNGKTSTAHMIEAILSGAGLRCGLIGTVGCRACGTPLEIKRENELANMTTPDPAALYALLAEMRERRVTHVVMEVSSHALALNKVAPLFFKRGVFTNLTADHLDFHGDMEQYYLAKKSLFSSCGGAVISLFSPYGERLSRELSIPCFTVGAHNVREVRSRGDLGTDFVLSAGGKSLSAEIHQPGAFFVENAALAMMTAMSLGVGGGVAAAALQKFGGVKGRMERVEGSWDIGVFLDYAHTPDALEKLLSCVRGFRSPAQRIILVFGCGGDRDRSKRKEMGRIAAQFADLSVVTSDNCRSENPMEIIGEILRGIDKERPYAVIPDRETAIAFAIRVADPGDIVLLVGKGHEEYEIRGNQRLPFSERALAVQYLEKRMEEKARAD